MGNGPSLNWECKDPAFPVKGPLLGSCYKNCPEGYVHNPANFSQCILNGTPQPYGREAGSPLVCPDGKVKEENGLCFSPCQKGLKGNPTSLTSCVYDYRDIGPGKSAFAK